MDAAAAIVRAPDGTLVPGGVVQSESLPARVWRWPTRWMPETWPAWVVTLATVGFWAVVAWLVTRTLNTFK